MTFKFGRFELDEEKRQLRLSGRSVEMQPRVFDLLVYLVRNRERVVSKEEILSALWPDVIVTDASIQRAMSLLRSTLRGGDLPDAIKTFSRQGYRFCWELAQDEAQGRPSRDPNTSRARRFYQDGDWRQALEAYSRVSSEDHLCADDFEQWARSALCVGRPDDAVHPLERAVAAHIENADRVSAARTALNLTNLHLESRALSIARGWHRRAGAFLAEEKTETSEHGMHIWLSARLALFEGDLRRALDEARRAEALARRLEDSDLETLSLVCEGLVELAAGEIRPGLAHLDEAGAAALAGIVSPWVCGYVFCGIIWAHLDRGDLQRAGQWTDQFVRWCQQNTAFGFPGLCRLHRSEVLCIQGELQAAESEIDKARELLGKNARYAEGDAYRVLGEIRLLRGDWDGAEEAFRRAHELGWDPQPGWAQLQAERGHVSAAINALRRNLDSPGWAAGQRRGILLAHLVQIAARAGRLDVAENALAELDQSEDHRSAAGCEAMFHLARAEVAVATGELEKAIAALRKSLAIWLEVGSQINVAHLRLRLAEVLALAEDVDAAELELSSAEKAFAKMQATLMLDRCSEVRQRIVVKEQQPLRNAQNAPDQG